MSDTCPNCGESGWSHKKNYECKFCGYHTVESRQLEPADLIYCSGCGNYYYDRCPTHDQTYYSKPDFIKPAVIKKDNDS